MNIKPITRWVGPRAGTDALEREVSESLLAMKSQFDVTSCLLISCCTDYTIPASFINHIN
jgi:hypothetical protein